MWKKGILIVILLLYTFIITGCSNTKVVTSFELPYTQFTQPTLINNDLYISVNSNSEYLNQIVTYNIKNQMITKVYDTAYKEHSALNGLMGNDEWLVWVDSDSFGQSNKILALDRKTNEIKVISESDPDFVTVDAPFLYGHFVSWVYLNNGKPEVILYNLITNEKKKIAQLNEYALYNNFVHMNEQHLLWTDSIEGQGYYYIYDFKNENIESYIAPFTYPGYAIMSKNLIYSLNFSDFRSWSAHEFGVFDIQTQEYTTISTEYTNGFRIFDNLIAVTHSDQELHIFKNNKGQFEEVILNDDLKQKIFPADTVVFTSDGKLIVGKTDHDSRRVSISVLDF